MLANPGSAQAQENTGYQFDSPEFLATQLTWGVAHGVRLLALACARAGKIGMSQAAETWVSWQEREQATILSMQDELGRFYFELEGLAPDVIAAALGLKHALALPEDELAPACASLPEALVQPRYDLKSRRDEVLAKRREALLK